LPREIDRHDLPTDFGGQYVIRAERLLEDDGPCVRRRARVRRRPGAP
jgi:hypothetical protein